MRAVLLCPADWDGRSYPFPAFCREGGLQAFFAFCERPPFHGQAERGRRGRKLSDNAVLVAGATGKRPPTRRAGTIRSRKVRHIGDRKGSQMLKAPYKKDRCCGTRAPSALVFTKDRSAVFLYSGAFPAPRLLHCCQSDDGKPRADADENEPHSPGKDGPLQYGF